MFTVHKKMPSAAGFQKTNPVFPKSSRSGRLEPSVIRAKKPIG
jgi:hypothetical protein